LLAEQLHLVAEGASLVRREYFTAIGPVDILMRDSAGATVAIECLVLDYDAMRGIDDGRPRLF
jgi:RecB family endonuclease NucS